MLLVFSLVSNTKNLLSTKVKGKGHIHCLDGIRLFSFAWVMISHVGLNLGFQLPLTNTKHVTEVQHYKPIYLVDYTGYLAMD